MTITTAGAAVHLAPTITKTFFKHYYKKAKRSFQHRSRSRNHVTGPRDNPNATDEFMFDEAFHIVKAFISLATNDTVEAIQSFTDAPAPPIPWATTLPVMVPMESCDKAAKLIIDHLGPQDLQTLVGGEKWWQLRPLPGVQGEWIAMSDDWKKMKTMEKQAQQKQNGNATSKPATSSKRKHKQRRNARHERALSEVRAMRQKTEAALKRRSQSFKRASQEARRQDHGTAPNSAASAEASDDGASIASSERAAPGPDMDSTDFPPSDSEAQNGAAETEELDRLQRVMLYFHGGGYYFGSLATHRYQIVRYARKFGGKCFAPVYRKAPQYPWPCALQDAVASYLYLIDPPKGAKHRPVDPKKLVVAGDSAGGGLTLALLTVIRDMGLPAPAGAVLISPWCDLTHSFPSILQNTATDIIPPYGFIHKPSTLWPVNATKPVSEEKGKQDNTERGENGGEQPRRKVPVGVQDESYPAGDEGNAELAVRKSRDGGNARSSEGTTEDSNRNKAPTRNGVPPAPDLLWSDPITIHRSDPGKEDIELREQIQLYATNDQLTHPLCSAVLSGSLGGLPPLYILAGDAEVLRDEIIYLAHRAAHPHLYPLRKDLLDHSTRNRENAKKYDSQPTKVHLQVYDQMCHVLTAFAFTSQSRFAYRAVASFVKHVTGAPTNIRNPFPQVAEGEQGPELEDEWGRHEGGEGDDEGGVGDNLGGEVVSPPLGVKTSQHSMLVQDVRQSPSSAADATHATPSSSQQGKENGGLTAATSLGDVAEADEAKTTTVDTDVKSSATRSTNFGHGDTFSSSPLRTEPDSLSLVEQPGSANVSATSSAAPATSSARVEATAESGKTRHRSMSKVISDTLHGNPSGNHASSRHAIDAAPALETGPRHGTGDVANEYTGQVPLLRPSFHSFMIRERVDVRGYLRPLEPETELAALQIDPNLIGCIKEGPVERYLDGQHQWAKRFAKTARRVEKHRAKNEQLAVKILEEAASQGLLDREGLETKRNGLMRNAAGEGGGELVGTGSNSSSSRFGLGAAEVASEAEKCREKWSWLVGFGPMDLVGETPPPAAIVGRRDTHDALVLLRRSLQIRARAYGVHRKSRFWGAEDRPVKTHFHASSETELNTETSTDPTGQLADPDGKGNKGKAGHQRHHHRGLSVWNLLMVRKPPSLSSSSSRETTKPEATET